MADGHTHPDHDHRHGHGHHHHGHHHGHGHGHVHIPRGTGAARHRKRIVIALVLAATYMFAELIGGILANSLALLADAGHMLSDVGALALCLFAIWIAQRPATERHTYGYYRTEILAALANAAALIAISGYILYEAIRRLLEPQPVVGSTMMIIATGGLIVNLLMLWVLNEGKGESLNVRGAWLHVLSDMLGSVGTLIGGALVLFMGWNWADPLVSLVIVVLVVIASWALMRESVSVLLEGTPAHIDVSAVREAIGGVDGVLDVHDLHIWTITSGMEAMSGHAVVDEGRGARPYRDILDEVRTILHDRFGIDHVTVQLEPPDFPERETHF